MSLYSSLIEATDTLVEELAPLQFSEPVTHVYNPLVYARKPHYEYLKRFGATQKRTVLLGMNPGPFGMAQTGIPFGEIPSVRDWMGITAPVEKPKNEHPKRPVTGFDCTRSEVSGRRLWGLFSERHEKAEAFFADHFVINYCPLVFMEESGKNRTPDKIPANEMAPVYAACDRYLATIIKMLAPTHAVGVGAWAEKRLRAVLGESAITISTVLHPSPASPAANRGWAEAATRQLTASGVWG